MKRGNIWTVGFFPLNCSRHFQISLSLSPSSLYPLPLAHSHLTFCHPSIITNATTEMHPLICSPVTLSVISRLMQRDRKRERGKNTSEHKLNNKTRKMMFCRTIVFALGRGRKRDAEGGVKPCQVLERDIHNRVHQISSCHGTKFQLQPEVERVRERIREEIGGELLC